MKKQFNNTKRVCYLQGKNETTVNGPCAASQHSLAGNDHCMISMRGKGSSHLNPQIEEHTTVMWRVVE